MCLWPDKQKTYLTKNHRFYGKLHDNRQQALSHNLFVMKEYLLYRGQVKLVKSAKLAPAINF